MCESGGGDDGYWSRLWAYWSLRLWPSYQAGGGRAGADDRHRAEIGSDAVLTFQARTPTLRNAPERPAPRERRALRLKGLLGVHLPGASFRDEHVRPSPAYAGCIAQPMHPVFRDEHVWPRSAHRVSDRRLLNVDESARGGGALGYPTLAGKSPPPPPELSPNRLAAAPI